MRLTFGLLILLFSANCIATENLDCKGDPFSLTMHVDGDNRDILTKVILRKSDRAEPFAVYDKSELAISIFQWSGKKSSNLVSFISTPDTKAELLVTTKNSIGSITVNGDKFKLKCIW